MFWSYYMPYSNILRNKLKLVFWSLQGFQMLSNEFMSLICHFMCIQKAIGATKYSEDDGGVKKIKVQYGNKIVKIKVDMKLNCWNQPKDLLEGIPSFYEKSDMRKNGILETGSEICRVCLQNTRRENKICWILRQKNPINFAVCSSIMVYMALLPLQPLLNYRFWALT